MVADPAAPCPPDSVKRQFKAQHPLEWTAWFNHHRLLEPLGYTPSAEAEADYCTQLSSQAIPA